jgi:hypothetical protein
MDQTLEIIEVDDTRLEDVLGRAEQALTAEDARLLRALFRSYVYVAELVDNKNTTIHRLRRLFFGARTEKTAAVLAKADEASKTDTRGASESAVATRSSGAAAPSKQAPEVDEKPAAKGHGRNGADSYPGAERIKVANASLSAGDACPTCHKGVLSAWHQGFSGKKRWRRKVKASTSPFGLAKKGIFPRNRRFKQSFTRKGFLWRSLPERRRPPQGMYSLAPMYSIVCGSGCRNFSVSFMLGPSRRRAVMTSKKN